MTDYSPTMPWYMRLLDKRVIVLLLFGFSAGLPILLIFSTLSLWLSEAGSSRSTVTFFSWAALGYSFKFIWAPLVDKLPLPALSRTMGRRRSWLLLSQLAVIAAICWMALTDPVQGISAMALAAVMLGFSSATQDIVIDAYRIECADEDMQALLSSVYIAGYRIGMIVAGAGGLFLAEELGSTGDHYLYSAWRNTYLIMAAVMGVGVLTTLFCREPDQPTVASDAYPHSGSEYLRLLCLFVVSVLALIVIYRVFPVPAIAKDSVHSHLLSFVYSTFRLICAIGVALAVAYAIATSGFITRDMLRDTYISPVMDFFRRYGRFAIWVLLLVGFYRVSDIVMGVVANIFYADMGYSKKEIASVTKVFGLLMTIAGSFIGGALAVRYGVKRVLLLGAILAALTNLLFMAIAGMQADLRILTFVIAADNLSAGLAVASSVMTFFPKVLGGYSGSIVDGIGYQQFFLLTACMGIPVIALVLYIDRRSS